MDKKVDYQGDWWLPETPETKIPGTLNYEPSDRPRLELQGVLSPSIKNPFRTDFINPPLIHGFSVNGKNITLYKCTQTKGPVHIPGMQLSTFIAAFSFIGIHFETVEEIKFKKIMVRYANLDEWADTNGFSIEEYADDWRKLTIKYSQPDSVSAIVDGFEITIVFKGPNFSTRSLYKEINIAQNTWIEICAQNEEISIERYLDLLRYIQNFLTLAMGAPTFPVEIKGITDANKETLSTGYEYSPVIDIYYPVPYWPNEIKKRESNDMLFTLHEIESEFQYYFSNWMERSEILRPVMNLYFSNLYGPNIYMEIKFLTLAQAVETYHRRVNGGKFQADDEFLNGIYKELIKVIPDNLDHDFKTSLVKGKLRYANEYSLRRRIKELIRDIRESCDLAFISDSKERDFFIEDVVNTRNYLTHYSEELEDKAKKSGKELFYLVKKLQIILELCLLKELGFSKESISKILPRSDHRRWIPNNSD